MSYECKFLNKTGESAGLQYVTDVHLKWNAGKPSSVPMNDQADLLVMMQLCTDVLMIALFIRGFV